MKRFFNPCGRHRRDICLRAANLLAEPEAERLDRHLAACADCRSYAEEIEAVRLPLANWAGNSRDIPPGPATQARWAKAILAAGRPARANRPASLTAFQTWWQDVIWPSRRIWAGLVAVWVVILAVNFSQRDRSAMTITRSQSAAEMASFRDQQKLLNELLAERSWPVAAEPRKLFLPKPRTEIAETATV
jgi:hypothetical protein